MIVSDEASDLLACVSHTLTFFSPGVESKEAEIPVRDTNTRVTCNDCNFGGMRGKVSLLLFLLMCVFAVSVSRMRR